MKRTGALFLPRLSPSSTKSSKMALACIRTAKTNLLALPFLVSTARVELTRNISKMARSCKAGRNKRREVKVGLKFSIQICPIPNPKSWGLHGDARSQILIIIDREEMIDDIISHGKWRHLRQKCFLIPSDVYSTWTVHI